MTINLQKPDITELKPKITVFGVGGGGGNAVNNMIQGGLEGVEFVVANTDAQALSMSSAEKIIQLGVEVTEGLGAGSQPAVGAAAAEECMTEIQDYLQGTHMAFVTAGMGGGTGTGAAPVVARAAREMGVLTVGVVTKPFMFEGQRRLNTAEEGIAELQKQVDTLIVIPNQNLFRIANEKTTFSDAFGMADQVLYSGVACITDLMVKEGLINLDFADVRAVMADMGKAMMGTGEASGDGRAMQAAEAAISNPLLDETSMRGAQGLLISITGGRDLTLFEVDEAATRIREEVDQEANIILGATFDENLEGVIRVSVVATGIDNAHEANFTQTAPQQVSAMAKPTAIPAPSAIKQSAPAPQAIQAPASASFASEIKQQQQEQVAKKIEDAAANLKAAGKSQSVERDGVELKPYQPSGVFSDPVVESELKSALEQELSTESNAFVIPAAEEPSQAIQTAVIPEVSEFPPMVQAEVSKEAAPAQNASSESHGPMGLLNKLKNSFVKAEEEHQSAQQAQPAAAQPRAPAPQGGQAQRVEPQVAPMQQKKAPPPVATASSGPRVDNNPYAPKRGQLDTMGRINPSEKPAQDEDQLDIPAFLRRQAN